MILGYFLLLRLPSQVLFLINLLYSNFVLSIIEVTVEGGQGEGSIQGYRPLASDIY